MRLASRKALKGALGVLALFKMLRMITVWNGHGESFQCPVDTLPPEATPTIEPSGHVAAKAQAIGLHEDTGMLEPGL